MYMYKYVLCMQVIIDKQCGYQFEGGWREAYGRIWRKEREERNFIIKHNLQNFRRKRSGLWDLGRWLC